MNEMLSQGVWKVKGHSNTSAALFTLVMESHLKKICNYKIKKQQNASDPQSVKKCVLKNSYFYHIISCSLDPAMDRKGTEHTSQKTYIVTGVNAWLISLDLLHTFYGMYDMVGILLAMDTVHAKHKRNHGRGLQLST